MATVLITIMGRDRPAVLEPLSQAVALRRGTWRDVQFARIGDRFIGMGTVELPDNQVNLLLVSLHGISTSSVKATVLASRPEPSLHLLQVHLIGPAATDTAMVVARLGPLGLRVVQLRSSRHEIEDEDMLGLMMMLEIGPQAHEDVAEAAMEVLHQLGLDGSAEEIFG